MRTILSTVGTSLATNARRQGRPTTPDGLLHFLANIDPVQACAETHGLARMDLSADDRLVFVHSDTQDGENCGLALCRHYANRGIAATARRAPGLTYEPRALARKGLRGLVGVLAETIRKERREGREVAINATGGFKAETAYATLVGLLMNAPVHYVYESFGEAVLLPALPIAWDVSLLSLHKDFFEWIEAEPRPAGQVRERARDLPSPLLMLLDEPEDGLQMLSAAGRACYEAFLEILEEAPRTQVLFSARARKTYADADPATKRAFDPLLRNLEVRELWINQCERDGPGAVLVYPRGRKNERLFVAEESDGRVLVLELARHSDRSYESLRRRCRRDDYDDFAALDG